ncbi:MAG: cation:proton antiporter, partial [Candidatus Micrarchaeota archaeon]
MADLILGVALAGAIIFAGFLAAKLFEATNVPDILILIAFGAVVGPLLGLVDAGSLTPAMPFFAATALVIIMLAAGQRFNFYRVVSDLPSASVFAFFAYFVSAALITAVAHLVFGWQLMHAAFLAFVLSGSCPTIVGSIADRLRASESTKVSLSLEATISDALGSVFAVVVLRLISVHSLDAAIPLHEVAAAFAIAIVGGAVAGFVWVRLLRELGDRSYEYLLTLGAALFLYAAANYVGGNGAISVLVFGLVLGNAAEL